MTLADLGYTDELDNHRRENGLETFEVGRVTLEHKERYTVRTADKEYDAELIGNLRFTAESSRDFPAVGDWVAISEYDEDKALIHSVYPRSSIIERKAVGKSGQSQIIAANIDFGLIVQAVDRDFNINRIERYLTICNSSKVKPIIVLTKIDLIYEKELGSILEELLKRVKDVDFYPVSSETMIGLNEFSNAINAGLTYCMLGSSGVGKSTLLNNIAGSELMATKDISTSVNKGRHTTSHRELVVLESGGIIIDNPGMREVGIADTSSGLETTFEEILTIGQDCRFKDCSHLNEVGCRVLEAVNNGKLDNDSYNNFLKMEREKARFQSTVAEKRRLDRDMGKMYKSIMAMKKKRKG